MKYLDTFSSFSVNDLGKARKFYEEILGLDVRDNPMGLLELHLSENKTVMVYPKPDHQPASFTVFNFVVADIEQAVDDLIRQGVTFEQYKGTIDTDAKGISRSEHGPAIAWFKDPSGNILSVIQGQG
ncbi:VOC family protein [Marinoscillum sp.]|uniref:VOC family protein n=1 Tax=Marinoscillum sp. TaxID=2024838 RepID=UPI003BA98B35